MSAGGGGEGGEGCHTILQPAGAACRQPGATAQQTNLCTQSASFNADVMAAPATMLTPA